MADPKSKAREYFDGAVSAIVAAFEKNPRKVAIGVLVLLGLLVVCQCSHAAPVAGEVTLTMAQTTRSDGKLDVTLTWDTVPKANGCVATGGWTGSRAASRSTPLVIQAVTPPKDFTLTCSWVDPDVDLSWVAPTQNADGTTLTDLAGYRVYYGTSPTALSQSVAINSAAATTYKLGPLAAGVWSFAMTAVNTAGRESERSATVAATVGSADASKTVTATANAPKAPTGLAVTP